MVRKRVLVTGGSGYIGARLCLHLSNQGYAVTSLCHSKIPSDENWTTKMDRIVIGDVRDESLLIELAKYNYHTIVHLVSLDHNQSNGSPSIVSDINVTPVWSILDIFSKRGLDKFIYFSTAQTYGILQNEIVTEERNLSTQNAYGLSHQIGEVICDYYNRTSSVNCSIVRLSNSYGAPIFEENNCWWLVVNDLCKMAYTKNEITLQSDGAPLRDFIHGWDVCKGVQTIIETNELDPVYNLSSGLTHSIMDIAIIIKNIFFKRYGTELNIKASVSKNSSPSSKYKIDNSLLRSIGFEPDWGLEAGIHDLFDYFENNNNILN